jgi:hypothetical protein
LDEQNVVQQFQRNVNFDGERYEVELPWKRNCPKLVNNRDIAMKRLLNIESKLSKNPEQEDMYKESINQYIKDGHAREITANDDKAEKVHYLPHHHVFRQDKSSSKCRAVSDVRKMFIQIKVAWKDQNVHRFLWRNMD